MHYIIVTGSNLEELDVNVNKKILDGYLPTGSIFKDSVRTRTNAPDTGTSWSTVSTYIQTMIRTVPVSGIQDFRNFRNWDFFASDCPDRHEIFCFSNAVDKQVDANGHHKQCNADNCPREDKPKEGTLLPISKQ